MKRKLLLPRRVRALVLVPGWSWHRLVQAGTGWFRLARSGIRVVRSRLVVREAEFCCLEGGNVRMDKREGKCVEGRRHGQRSVHISWSAGLKARQWSWRG